MCVLAACDDFNDKLDGYDEDVARPVDIKNEKYVVTSNDYAKMAVQADAAAISTNKAFDNAEQAHTYIPFLLKDVYPVADNGSTIRVGYDVIDDAASCLTRLRKAKSYTLTADDYGYVYGDEEDEASSLSAWEKVARLLADKMPGANDGDIVMVNYNDGGDGSGLSSGNAVAGFTASRLFSYDGNSWKELSSAENIVPISPSVYNSIGAKFIEKGEEMMPKYLGLTYPYAKEGDTHTVAYYYNKYKDVGALKYVFEDGAWVKTGESFKQTKVQNIDPFVLAAGEWRYDPSVTVGLPAVKKDPASVRVYQAMVDWVWENVDKPAGVSSKGTGYVAKYGDTDFYTGATAYDCVVDWKAEDARKQCAGAYKDMTDEEITAAMQKNFIQVLGHALSKLYPAAETVQGLDVIYTVNFSAKTSSETRYTIEYKVVGKAEFQYVEGSMKAL